MNDEEITGLAQAWLESQRTSDANDAALNLGLAFRRKPETAWRMILKILQADLTPEDFASLAAGPLENLLSQHGTEYIDRVEMEAGINPKFNELLGGVWQQRMSEDVWKCVQAVRKSVW